MKHLIEPPLYVDKHGKEITVQEWVKLFEDKTYSIIKQDKIGQYFVSTVWIGVWHMGGNYFETMIFCDDETSDQHNRLWRYATLEEAQEGHNEIVEIVEVAKNEIL